MSTAEIAEEVDASKSWKNLHFRLMCLARTYAFTIFVFQYSMYLGAHILLILALTTCTLLVELRANQYALTIYSTSQIVDHWLKRTEIEVFKPRWRNLYILISIYFIGIAGFLAGAPLFFCHTALFLAIFLTLLNAKTQDHMKTPILRNIGRSLDPEEGFFDGAAYQGIFPYTIVLIIPPVFYFAGGVIKMEPSLQMVVGLSVLGPFIGCTYGEAMRFLLVRKEMERLQERLSLSSCEETGSNSG